MDARRLGPDESDQLAIIRETAPAYTEWLEWTLDNELGLTPRALEYQAVAYNIADYLTDPRKHPAYDSAMEAEPKLVVAEGVRAYLARMAIPDETRIKVVGSPNYLHYQLKIRELPRNVSYEVIEAFSPPAPRGDRMQRRLIVARKVLLGSQIAGVGNLTTQKSLECQTVDPTAAEGLVQLVATGTL